MFSLDYQCTLHVKYKIGEGEGQGRKKRINNMESFLPVRDEYGESTQREREGGWVCGMSKNLGRKGAR